MLQILSILWSKDSNIWEVNKSDNTENRRVINWLSRYNTESWERRMYKYVVIHSTIIWSILSVFITGIYTWL